MMNVTTPGSWPSSFTCLKASSSSSAKDHLSADIWNEYELLLVGMLQTEIARRWWTGVAPPFSESFRTHIEARLESGSGWRPDVVARYAQPGPPDA